MSIVYEAQIFATESHKNQVRKYTGEPYINHPAAVVEILKEVEETNEFVLAAAWLHDVIEDRNVPIRTLIAEFGYIVAKYVYYLTDCDKHFGNRKDRKKIDRERLGSAVSEVQTIKLADMLDNTSSIVEHDPKFAVVYMKEKSLLLPFLTKGNPLLWSRAMARVVDYEENQLNKWLESKLHD